MRRKEYEKTNMLLKALKYDPCLYLHWVPLVTSLVTTRTRLFMYSFFVRIAVIDISVLTRMHSSRMRTARSLIVSPYLVISHAHPPEQPCMPPQQQPRTPPKQPCMPPPSSNHSCPPERRCMPPPGSNQTCPHQGSNHTCSPWEQPLMLPGSNHTCPLRSNHAHPPRSNHAHSPRATTHAPLPCGQNHRHL